MIFKALACDYDGTLASEDRIGGEALAALERARREGVRLILITGRTFFELIRVCEPIDLFDVIVAENGGVLYFPATGVMRDQAPPPPARVLAELDGRGVPFQVGRVIVGTWRSEEGRVRDALAALGVHMELVYNRAALMLLPPGISKGTGVRQAIHALGLSFHDVLALGDAENDIEFFHACGWRACPANAVLELKAEADWVFAGDDGQAVARAIAGPILDGLLPVADSRRHRLAIGWSGETAEPVIIPERGVNVLVQGDTLSGKSWLAGVLVERLLDRRYSVCIVDPEGDYQVLAPLPGVSWLEVGGEGEWERALDHFDYDPSACVVLDLSALDQARKVDLVETGMAQIRERRRRSGLPHWIVFDEAHYSLHRGGLDEAAMGLADKGFCLVTYLGSLLRASVLKAVDLWLLARTTSATELCALRAVLPGTLAETVVSALPNLPRGEFILVRPDAAAPSALTFAAAPRLTSHVRHLRKYAEGRLPRERCFFFTGPDGRLVATAENLGGFLDAMTLVGDEVLGAHARRGDFSRWLLDVFADRELGRQLAKIERRWSRGESRDLRPALGRLIASAIKRSGERSEGARRGR